MPTDNKVLTALNPSQRYRLWHTAVCLPSSRPVISVLPIVFHAYETFVATVFRPFLQGRAPGDPMAEFRDDDDMVNVDALINRLKRTHGNECDEVRRS